MITLWEITGDIGYVAVYGAAFQKELPRLRALVILATILFLIQDIYFGFWTNVALGVGYIAIHCFRLAQSVRAKRFVKDARTDASAPSIENIKRN